MNQACTPDIQARHGKTALHDYHTLENAIGKHLHHDPGLLQSLLPADLRLRWYRFGVERGYLDSSLDAYVVHPFRRFFEWCDANERRWTDFLSGGRSRESDDVEVHSQVVEELRL